MPQTLPDQIRSQLREPAKHFDDVLADSQNLALVLELIGRFTSRDIKWQIVEAYNEALAEKPITVTHAGGTVTLTPEQARQVLAGGELVVTLGKAEVR